MPGSGIRLGVVVSDLHVKSARAMVKAIISGQTPRVVLKLASTRLKASREEILDALQGDLTASYRFVLDELIHHIEEIEVRIARFDARLLSELESERNTLAQLQTIPGVDLIGAAMLLVEIGSDIPSAVQIGWPPGSESVPETTSRLENKIRPRSQGQPLRPSPALRIRSRRQSYSVRVQVEVPVAPRPPWLQARNHRHRPQNWGLGCRGTAEAVKRLF